MRAEHPQALRQRHGARRSDLHAQRAAQPGRGGACAAAPLPAAQRPRARADGVAGLLLQRDLLHLRAGADPLLRRGRHAGRPLPPALRRRQRAGAAAPGAAVRPHRAARDDRARPTRCRAWACCSSAWASSTACSTRRRRPWPGRRCSSWRRRPRARPTSRSAKSSRSRCARISISIFYAVGTGVGGFAAPALFGALIETGDRVNVFQGYLVGAVLVLVAAVIAWRYGRRCRTQAAGRDRPAAGNRRPRRGLIPVAPASDGRPRKRAPARCRFQE